MADPASGSQLAAWADVILTALGVLTAWATVLAGWVLRKQKKRHQENSDRLLKIDNRLDSIDAWIARPWYSRLFRSRGS